MIKLKTLKDWEDKFRDIEKFLQKEIVEKMFAKEGVEFKLTPVDDVNIPIKELRQEAIKWIKEEITIKINTWLPAPEKEIQLIGMAVINHPEIQRWMNRFNIKDEELK